MIKSCLKQLIPIFLSAVTSSKVYLSVQVVKNLNIISIKKNISMKKLIYTIVLTIVCCSFLPKAIMNKYTTILTKVRNCIKMVQLFSHGFPSLIMYQFFSPLVTLFESIVSDIIDSDKVFPDTNEYDREKPTLSC